MFASLILVYWLKNLQAQDSTNSLHMTNPGLGGKFFHTFSMFTFSTTILMTNSPRQQNKNKVNVCSILVNRKKNYSLSLIDWMIFGYIHFIIILFLRKFWSFIIWGHVDVARLTSFHQKRTYNHSIWNLIFNIYLLLLNYFYYISTFHLLISKYVVLYFQHYEIYSYSLKHYLQMTKYC